jgi:hypothetical protein
VELRKLHHTGLFCLLKAKRPDVSMMAHLVLFFFSSAYGSHASLMMSVTSFIIKFLQKFFTES